MRRAAGERLFYFTTLGWMMWNWLASGLASEATLLLYDGSPFAPNPAVLWDFAQDTRMTVFGTSAKYIDGCAKAGLTPAKTHDLSALRLSPRPAPRSHPKVSNMSTARSKRTCTSPRFRAAPISCPASFSAIRPHRCGKVKSRPRASAWRSTSIRTTARPCAKRRANSSAQSRSSRCR